jgi:hypothetical protein
MYITVIRYNYWWRYGHTDENAYFRSVIVAGTKKRLQHNIETPFLKGSRNGR